MYEPYWSLNRRPFQRTQDRFWFVPVDSAHEALSRLQYLVEESRRCGLLTGPAGTGKTFLISVLEKHARRQGQEVVRLNCAGLGRDEFPAHLAEALGLIPSVMAPAGQHWRLLQQNLEGRRLTGPGLVLILDQFDQAAAGCDLPVQRLLALAETVNAPLCVVLVARQGTSINPATKLAGLSELRMELLAWTPGECAEYIQTTLRKAGASRDVFTPPALFRVWFQTAGIAVRVAQLCDLALLAAMERELPLVDCDVVDSVAEELGFALPDQLLQSSFALPA